MIEYIRNIFRKYNFIEWDDFSYKNDFTLCFRNSYEAYLIKKYDYEPDVNEIESLEDIIYDFLIKLPNSSELKYNTNLLICHSFNEKPRAVILERDKYTCRKFFINTQNIEMLNDDLKILPFVDINLERENELNDISLSEILKQHLGEENYNILSRDKFNIADITE
jgi:hypothetical protein